jgi:stage II sporulation protein D
MRKILLFTVLALAACRPAGPVPEARPEGVGALPAREPVVRIGIAVDTTQVTVSAPGRLTIASALGGDAVSVPGGVEVAFRSTAEGRVVGSRQAGGEVGPFQPPVRVTGEANGILIDGRTYRGGALLLAPAPGRITAANIVEMEAYLLGVVPHEIGRRPPAEIEVVKAQAIAARTYAVGHMGRREALGFDFFATVQDQVYGGSGGEDTVANRAVRETRGEVILHDGRPILAYYSSTCGGRTAAIEDVWRQAPLPYLKSESDMIPGTDRAYCEPSSRYRWTERWTGEQLATILSRTMVRRRGENAPPIQRVDDVRIERRTPAGRAQETAITVDGQRYVVFGDSVRWILHATETRPLNGTFFDLIVEPGPEGLASLEARGGGWGHGIGMCQWGAIGRSRAGHDYRQILTHYYRGTQVVRLY